MNSTAKALTSRLAASFLLLFLGGVVTAQSEARLKSITYRLSMTRPVSHLFEVAIEVELSDGAPSSLDFQMPKWSPGRYAVFDFAKNVQEFQALGGICPRSAQCKMSVIPSDKIDEQTWRVSTGNTRNLTVRYKVFGNDLSGTFSQLDPRHANYNGHSLFMYIVGHKADPVKLEIDPPTGWRIVNGRSERMDQRAWQFPNWDEFVDTPTEIAPDWTVDEFQVDGKRYRVVVHSFGDEGGKRPALVRDIEKIVRAQVAMWGPPDFDTYTFLIHFAADDHSGDGMEHLNSTQIIEPGALGESGVYASALGTVSHEFFHVWNVKRLRPIEFGPWDFTRPANTRSLWIAEGLTNYYGHMMMHRAGIWDTTQFLNRQSQTITGIENAPGTALTSAEASSLSAPFIDDAPHAQQTNLHNTAISYYPKGELVGMVLDLIIRGKTNGKASLDEVMRRMYQQFYLNSPNATYYLRGRGYTPQEFQRVTSEVAGFDLSDFFARYVRETETLPYDEAFAYVGLRVVRSVSREPYSAGVTLDWEDEASARIGTVRNYSPAEDAGLQAGDEVLSLGGKNIKRENWLFALSRYKEGDRIPIVVKRDRRTIRTTLVLGPPERFDFRIEELTNTTPQQRALREAWLRGR
ncbi:MAG TPA: PDZ domain-containing protein [Pyrinomonadaceae bacterium]|nr:PDZ domain-containing protein [Pyrinomonadaceae bacterium]